MGSRISPVARERSKGGRLQFVIFVWKRKYSKSQWIGGIEWCIRSDELPGIVPVMYSGGTSGFRVMREKKRLHPMI